MRPLPEIEQLAERSEWIRRLARRLVPDAGTADDVVQDAWVAALERPAAIRSPKSWLAGVVRNLARQNARGEARRTTRERAAAKPEAVPSAHELAEELGVQREVQGCVLALPEPYRTVLLLRYFKDLPLARVAEAQGVSISTVHSREQRALELLRARLDRAHGGERRRWAPALLSSGDRSAGGLIPVGTGAFIVSSTLKIAAAGVAVALGLWGLWAVGASQDPRSIAARGDVGMGADPPGPSADRSGSGTTGLPADFTRERAAVAAPTTAAQDAAATTAIVPIAGRVVDLAGHPVPYVEIALRSDEAEWTNGSPPRTDDQGAFGGELELRPGARARLFVEQGDWVTVVDGRVGERAFVTVVVSARRSYGGRVTDERGAPLPDALVSVEVAAGLYRELGLFHTEATTATVRTDAHGHFLLEDVGGGARVTLNAAKEGYGSTRTEAPEHTTLDLELAVHDPARTLSGRVIDPEGRPVEGAYVSFGGWVVGSGLNGAFEIPLDPSRSADVLVAVSAGYLPGRITLDDPPAEPLTVQLGAQGLTITGRVVDPVGAPVPRVTVWVGGLTPFGNRLREGASHAYTVHLEELAAGAGGGPATVTDAQGRFHLDGLADREYELRTLDPRGLHAALTEDVPAGARDVVIVLDRSREVTRLRGVVRSLSGEPLAGVRVTPFRDMGASWTQVPAPPGAFSPTAVTDELGRFALGPLLPFGTHLKVRRPGLQSFASFSLDDFEDLTAMDLALPLLCEVQLDLGEGPGRVHGFRVLDEDEDELETVPGELELAGSRSDVFRVSEVATTVVLYGEEDEEIARREVRLDPRRLNVVGR